MKKTIYEYIDYKVYLEDLIHSKPNEGRGVKAKLAEAIRVQTAYVSQVFNGSAHFSLEQADEINRFLGHRRDESSYFLLLVQHARAGTPSLREHFMDQIVQLREARANPRRKGIKGGQLSSEDQVIYYSYWEFAAVHVLISLPQFGTQEAIAQYLSIPPARVAEILDFLMAVGLARREGNQYRVGATQIHLDRESPMVARYHGNWRLRCMQMIDRSHRDNLHYSSVMTIAREDVERLKAMIREFIQTTKPVIRESKDEVAQCFLIDFFPV
jgi:uncharacterized protein (TIGR02147 family)